MTANARPAPAWDEEAAAEAITATLAAHDLIPQGAIIDGDSCIGCRCGEAFLARGEATSHVAAAALAAAREHLPVKPDRETVIAALAGLTREQWDRDPGADLMREALRARFGAQADAMLDLWPGRSEVDDAL